MIARPLLALAVVLVPAAARASPPRPVVALTASPAHIVLAGRGRSSLRVANSGAARVVVEVSTAGFALGARGRPRALLRGAGVRRASAWLVVRPRRIELAPGAAALLTVAATPPARAAPGDHPALVLLTTRSTPGVAVGVRMRLGVTVVVRAPGRIEHRLSVRALRVHRGNGGRRIELLLANDGNVIEQLPRGRVTVVLTSRGRVLARLRSSPRELLPRTSGIVELAYPGRLRGQLTARVTIDGGPRWTLRSRSYRVQL